MATCWSHRASPLCVHWAGGRRPRSHAWQVTASWQGAGSPLDGRLQPSPWLLGLQQARLRGGLSVAGSAKEQAPVHKHSSNGSACVVTASDPAVTASRTASSGSRRGARLYLTAAGYATPHCKSAGASRGRLRCSPDIPHSQSSTPTGLAYPVLLFSPVKYTHLN